MKYITTLVASLICLPALVKAEKPEIGVESENPAHMLVGDWFEHPHTIDFNQLPRVPRVHAVISDVTAEGGVNQHNYLAHFDGRFWAMWSDGPGIEDRVGQVVKYATSKDGLDWSEAKKLTPYPPNSSPDSRFYNTNSREGYRYIARGFWQRKEGELLALVTLDEAASHFGPSLELLAFRWDKTANKWVEAGTVLENAINNFPPKKLPDGNWMMSRRPWNYRDEGVDFAIGGVRGMDDWELHPVPAGPLQAEEPYWWELPDGRLMALFRDNRVSRFLYRSVSRDNGRTWSQPLRTNFPDAVSKFHGTRLRDGRYVLVSNAYPLKRDPLTIAVSEDGMVFDRLFYLVGGEHNGVDYPAVLEHGDYLYIAHSGGRGERKRSVEIQRVRIDSLDRLDMPRMESVDQAQYGDLIPAILTLSGEWRASDKAEEKIGNFYYFLRPNDSGEAIFEADLPSTGIYAVYAWWNTRGTRYAAVPFFIEHAADTTRVEVDQRRNGGQWVRLGTYHFEAGTARVRIPVEGLGDFVVIVALGFKALD